MQTSLRKKLTTLTLFAVLGVSLVTGVLTPALATCGDDWTEFNGNESMGDPHEVMNFPANWTGDIGGNYEEHWYYPLELDAWDVDWFHLFVQAGSDVVFTIHDTYGQQVNWSILDGMSGLRDEGFYAVAAAGSEVFWEEPSIGDDYYLSISDADTTCGMYNLTIIVRTPSCMDPYEPNDAKVDAVNASMHHDTKEEFWEGNTWVERYVYETLTVNQSDTDFFYVGLKYADNVTFAFGPASESITVEYWNESTWLDTDGPGTGWFSRFYEHWSHTLHRYYVEIYTAFTDCVTYSLNVTVRFGGEPEGPGPGPGNNDWITDTYDNTARGQEYWLSPNSTAGDCSYYDYPGLNVSSIQQHDYFNVTADPCCNFTLKVYCPSSLMLNLVLWSPKGFSFLENDSYATGIGGSYEGGYIIDICLAGVMDFTSDITIEIVWYGGAGNELYDLDLVTCYDPAYPCDDRYEENDIQPAATDLSFEHDKTETWSNATHDIIEYILDFAVVNDFDWYEIWVSAGCEVTFNVTFVSHPDVKWQAQNHDGSRTWYGDGQVFDDHYGEAHTFHATQDGNWYIEFDTLADYCLAYGFTVRVACPSGSSCDNDGYESNEDHGSATYAQNGGNHDDFVEFQDGAYWIKRYVFTSTVLDGASGDWDYFYVNLADGENATFDVAPTTTPVTATYYDTMTVMDWDTGYGGWSRLFEASGAKSFFISFNTSATCVPYEFNISISSEDIPCDDRWEPNDIQSSATNLNETGVPDYDNKWSGGGWTYHERDVNGAKIDGTMNDVDWFKLPVPAGCQVTFNVTYASASLAYRFYNTSGLIAQYTGPGGVDRVFFSPIDDWFYLMVEYVSAECVSYDLETEVRCEIPCTDDAWEENDSPSTPTHVTSTSQSSTFVEGTDQVTRYVFQSMVCDDQDWFDVTVPDGCTLEVNVSSTEGPLRFQIELTGGQVLKTFTGYPGQGGTKLIQQATGGIYLIRVDQGDCVPYMLTVDVRCPQEEDTFDCDCTGTTANWAVQPGDSFLYNASGTTVQTKVGKPRVLWNITLTSLLIQPVANMECGLYWVFNASQAVADNCSDPWRAETILGRQGEAIQWYNACENFMHFPPESAPMFLPLPANLSMLNHSIFKMWRLWEDPDAVSIVGTDTLNITWSGAEHYVTRYNLTTGVLTYLKYWNASGVHLELHLTRCLDPGQTGTNGTTTGPGDNTGTTPTNGTTTPDDPSFPAYAASTTVTVQPGSTAPITVTGPGGARVDIEINASGPVTVTAGVWDVNPSNRNPGFASQTGAVYFGITVDNQNNLNWPVRVTIQLPSGLPTDLTDFEIAGMLQCMTWNNVTNQWTTDNFRITVDQTLGIATIEITHLSVFALGIAEEQSLDIPGYSTGCLLVTLVGVVALLARKYRRR